MDTRTVGNTEEPDIRLSLIRRCTRPFPVNLILDIRHCNGGRNDSRPFGGFYTVNTKSLERARSRR